MKHRSALLVIAWTLSSVAWAGDPCETQSHTIEINACAKQRLDEQDKLLNVAYQALISALPSTNAPGVSGESPRALLVESQRRWIEFRDADCKAKYQIYADGTIRDAIYLSCMRERTEQRIKELASREWQGG